MPSAWVVVVYGDRSASVRAEQIAAARELATRTGARLLLRAYEPDIPEWAPNDWAGECARRAGFFGPPTESMEMIPGDEQVSLVGTSWLLRLAQRYRRLRRGERLHLPAPSPGEDGTGAVAFWDACARAGVGKRFDVVDVHAYSDEQVQTLPGLAHEKLGLPVDLTECSRADPALVATEVRANTWLHSACSFTQ